MSLISAQGLGKHYGSKVCFHDVTFTLNEGERIGLIGANGSGKTTLFRIILGLIEDFDGGIIRKKGMRVAALEQDPVFPAGFTVREAVLDGAAEISGIERQMHEIHERLAHGGDTERLLAKLADLETAFETAGGYALENRADRVLEGVGFPRDRHDAKIEELSGGERNRIALSRLMMTEPDVWLLDEPTNHLDLDGILFFEKLLQESKAAAIVISHDRRFLDDVTTRTLELEGGKLYDYPGPYSRARELREERLKSEWRAFDQQQGEIERQQQFIRKYLAGQRARQAVGRRKRLERLERLERPSDRARVMALDLPTGDKPGHKVLRAKGLTKAYGGRTLFDHVELEIERGETVGIVGPNGAGKSTLLTMLTEGVEGVIWGERVKRGTLTQREAFVDEKETTPFSFIRECQPRRTDQELRDTLAAMLFRAEEVEKPVSVLSGGERKRLMLTRLLLEGNNVLLLDEPTNHLDLPSRESLELALSAYEGTVIVVSHDRYFLDRIADRIFWIEDGEWRVTEGGFEEAWAKREEIRRERAAASKPAPVVVKLPKPGSKPAPSAEGPYAKLKTPELEERIMEAEGHLHELQLRFGDPAVFKDSKAVADVKKEIANIEKDLARLNEEYARR